MALSPNESTCSVCISANASDPGIITQINVACLRFTGYSRVELIGYDMSMLLPAPFSQSHSALFSEYLDSVQTESDPDVHQNHQLFIQHKSGLISAVDVVIRQFITSSGSSFVALLAPTSTSDQFAIISPYGVITSCTSGFAGMFALRTQQIAAGTVRVSAVIKDFESKVKQMETSEFVFLVFLFSDSFIES
jgi:PAS domain S-box-containing protein